MQELLELLGKTEVDIFEPTLMEIWVVENGIRRSAKFKRFLPILVSTASEVYMPISGEQISFLLMKSSAAFIIFSLNFRIIVLE